MCTLYFSFRKRRISLLPPQCYRSDHHVDTTKKQQHMVFLQESDAIDIVHLRFEQAAFFTALRTPVKLTSDQ